MNGLMEEYMCGDIWTWLQDTEVRVLRYWVYKRVFTPLEQEKKYVDQSEYEDSYCKKGVIRECVQLPDGDLLLGFQNYNEDCDFYDLPQYMEYYKLSEIRLAYNPEDMARDEDE